MLLASRLLLLLSACILSVVLQCLMVKADTKVLHMLTLNQPDHNSYNEILTLENDELVFKATWTVELGPPNKEGLIPIAITEYDADKYGYRSQYRTDEVQIEEERVGESFLKSAAG